MGETSTNTRACKIRTSYVQIIPLQQFDKNNLQLYVSNLLLRT